MLHRVVGTVRNDPLCANVTLLPTERALPIRRFFSWPGKRNYAAMRVVVVVGAAVVGLVAAVGVVFVAGMRAKSPAVLDAVRRASRAMKPLVLRTAGRPGSPNSVIEHTGRSSGRTYATPVVATPTTGGFAIALPYGRRADWLQNVLAAGRASLLHDGQAFDIDRPEVVSLDAVDGDFQPKEQAMHQRFKVQEALRVRTRFPEERPNRYPVGGTPGEHDSSLPDTGPR
jgi:deazaflavin-dependent oxidoreductase (nitroreductase family)